MSCIAEIFFCESKSKASWNSTFCPAIKVQMKASFKEKQKSQINTRDSFESEMHPNHKDLQALVERYLMQCKSENA